jgi:hypothetical protein
VIESAVPDQSVEELFADIGRVFPHPRMIRKRLPDGSHGVIGIDHQLALVRSRSKTSYLAIRFGYRCRARWASHYGEGLSSTRTILHWACLP